MPWRKADARRFQKKADTPKEARQWSKTANSVLERTGDEGRAVRSANAAVAKRPPKKGKYLLPLHLLLVSSCHLSLRPLLQNSRWLIQQVLVLI